MLRDYWKRILNGQQCSHIIKYFRNWPERKIKFEIRVPNEVLGVGHGFYLTTGLPDVHHKWASI